MPISHEAAQHRGRIAALTRAIRAGERPADDPALPQARRDLHDQLLAERVEKIIADWPELPEDQQQRIAALLSTAGTP